MIGGSVTIGVGIGGGAIPHTRGDRESGQGPYDLQVSHFRGQRFLFFRAQFEERAIEPGGRPWRQHPAGAQFVFTMGGDKKLATGQAFTAINNTAATAIAGNFTDPGGDHSPTRSRRLATAYSRFILAMKLALISAGQTASHS